LKKEPGKEVWDAFWSRKNKLDEVYPSSPALKETVFSHFQLQGMKILEVGAGTGRDSAAMAQAGAEVWVLDFSDKSLEIVAGLKKELGLTHLHLVRGDAFAAPFAENTFDLVFHQGLLEHFRNPQDLLKENHRILKPGGICLVDIPQTFHPYTLVKKALIAVNRWFAGWETQFTLGQLEDLMRQTGLEPFMHYGDWMQPNFFYRVTREALKKTGVKLPMYPLQRSFYHRTKDRFLKVLTEHRWSRYTQISIGVLGKKE
jgi:SAM-dependent methyltransferase